MCFFCGGQDVEFFDNGKEELCKYFFSFKEFYMKRIEKLYKKKESFNFGFWIFLFVFNFH